MRNARNQTGHCHLGYALRTQRWVSDMEIEIIPRKINIVSHQSSPNWQKQNAGGASTLGDPEEGLEK